jgi:hypothetical protein
MAAETDQRANQGSTAHRKGSSFMSDQSIDPVGQTTILEPLTVLETAALLEELKAELTMIEEAVLAQPDATFLWGMWRETYELRVEARNVFIRKFFEVN